MLLTCCRRQIKEKSRAKNPVNALHNKLQIQKNNNIDIVKEKNIEIFDRLKIEIHNINRLRLDEEKLQMLADQCNRDKMDIIGITETNIGEKEEKWLNTRHLGYESFWSKREEDKNKGAGVGILIR